MGPARPLVIRAVLDTNVVLSALLFKGPTTLLVPLWKRGSFVWLVSHPLLDEYIRTLHYPKFHLGLDQIRGLIEEDVIPHLTPVKAIRPPRVIHRDPHDNQVLACAVAGKADLIVTGDHDLLDLAQYRNIPIITIPVFLERLKSVR